MSPLSRTWSTYSSSEWAWVATNATCCVWRPQLPAKRSARSFCNASHSASLAGARCSSSPALIARRAIPWISVFPKSCWAMTKQTTIHHPYKPAKLARPISSMKHADLQPFPAGFFGHFQSSFQTRAYRDCLSSSCLAERGARFQHLRNALPTLCEKQEPASPPLPVKLEEPSQPKQPVAVAEASRDPTSEPPCGICNERSGDNWIALKTCNHQFHLTCVSQWRLVHNVCPTCSRAVSESAFSLKLVGGYFSETDVTDVSEMYKNASDYMDSTSEYDLLRVQVSKGALTLHEVAETGSLTSLRSSYPLSELRRVLLINNFFITFVFASGDQGCLIQFFFPPIQAEIGTIFECLERSSQTNCLTWCSLQKWNSDPNVVDATRNTKPLTTWASDPILS
eukprot:m.198757 g.198757  ORF g.198757 m.198757 type:complete len:396 (-) comp53793_c0_seq12:101-1288(-)